MLRDVKFFILGVLAAFTGVVLAQTRILDLEILEVLTLTRDDPRQIWVDTNAAADEGRWREVVVGDTFFWQSRTDAAGAGENWMTAARTGTDVDALTINPITTFQNSGFADNSAIQIAANQAALAFDETDAPVDEGKWDMGVSAGDFFLDLNSDAGAFQISAIEITRSGVNSISAFQIGGVDAFPETGTFESDWTNACTTTPTATIDYYKIGDIVTVIFEDAISCTSDSVDFNTGASELPTEITPARNNRVPISNLTDNGTGINGCIEFRSSGQIRLLNDVSNVCTVSGWTNSGTKGIIATAAATYMLGNP